MSRFQVKRFLLSRLAPAHAAYLLSEANPLGAPPSRRHFIPCFPGQVSAEIPRQTYGILPSS